MTATRATPPLLKRLNARTVLEAIRAGAPISRAEISRRAGISKPTVSLALQSLLDAGLVREAASPDGPSYGATFFEPVPEAALVLGVDLGARFLRGAVCDLRGEPRARQDVELGGGEPERVLAAIVELRESLVAATGLSESLIDSAVAGVPGVVDRRDGSIRLTHYRSLEGLRLGRELEERLGIPVLLDNDINLAALGEQWRGVARGVDDFVFVSVGTGLGSGLVVQGALHRGHHGAAGEIDYALSGLAGQGELDPCADALSALAARLAPEHPSRVSAPYEVRELFAAARSGDDLGRAVVAEAARRIALHVMPIAAVADVALVVLGGGIGANGDLLLEPVRALLGRHLPYPPRVESSSLGEAAVLTGALAVGLRAALDNVFERHR